MGLRTKVDPMVSPVTGGTIDFILKGIASQLGNTWVVLTKKTREVVNRQTSFLHI